MYLILLVFQKQLFFFLCHNYNALSLLPVNREFSLSKLGVYPN